MKPLVIGLGHRARQGKDSVAKFILNKYGKQNGGPYDIWVSSFGEALKREVNFAAQQAGGMYALYQQLLQGKFFGAPPLPDWVKFDFDPPMDDPLCPLGKQRFILQWWGSEFRRAQNPFYWVAQYNYALQKRQPQIAIITDVRFRNEFAYVKSEDIDGWTVKVERLGYSDVLAGNVHISERELLNAKWDGQVICEDDIVELERLAYQLFEQIVAAETSVPTSPLLNTIVRHG